MGSHIIKHAKLVTLIGDFFILGGLNAFIPNEQLGEVVPSFFGDGELADMSQVLGGQAAVGVECACFTGFVPGDANLK